MRSNPVLLLFAAFLFASGACTKEVSQEGPVHISSGQGNFYATIDGQPWQGDSIQEATLVNGTLTLTGISKTLDAIAIVLPGFQTGVYSVNAQSDGFAFFSNIQDTSNLYLSNSSPDVSKAGGTVSLTNVDTVRKTVSGTFQFNLYQESSGTTKTVTAGVFNDVSYTGSGTQLPPIQEPPGKNTDTLYAQVDTSYWEAAQVLVNAQSGTLIIGGISADAQQTLGLYMPATISAGTYSLDFSSGIYFATYSPTPTISLFSIGSGNSLTILENDTVNKRIKGNFSFVGKSQTDSSTATITNGYFSAGY